MNQLAIYKTLDFILKIHLNYHSASFEYNDYLNRHINDAVFIVIAVQKESFELLYILIFYDIIYQILILIKILSE